MPVEDHVAPVANFVGDGAVFDFIADGGWRDRSARQNRRFQKRVRKGSTVVPSELVPSGKITTGTSARSVSTMELSGSEIAVLRWRSTKTVPAMVASSPKNGQRRTSFFATKAAGQALRSTRTSR